MRDDFTLLASQVYAACGQQIDYGLCEMAVRDTFRDLLLKNDTWSWCLKRGVMTLPGSYSTGLASFIQFDNHVTGVGTAWTTAMIGRQIRAGIGDPYYTITDVTSSGALTIDPPWAAANAPSTTYSIFAGYIVPPDDFFSFVVVKDPARTRRLHLNVSQDALDLFDPRRSTAGQPVLLSPVDYAPSYSGKVYASIPVLQTVSTNPYPTAAGTYTGSSDSVIVVQILSGGAVDTATFQWKKGNAAGWTSGGVCSSLGNILPEGVGLSWPAGTYVATDTSVIRVSAISNPGLPRFEPWPKPSSETILPYQYLIHYPDIDDPGVALPRSIPGHVIKEGALGRIARLPGTDAKPNPFSQIARSERWEDGFTEHLINLMRQDEMIFVQSITDDISLPLAPLPFSLGGGGRSIDFDSPFDYPGFGAY